MQRERTPVEVRGGVVSGRIVTVLVISSVGAVIALWGALSHHGYAHITVTPEAVAYELPNHWRIDNWSPNDGEQPCARRWACHAVSWGPLVDPRYVE